MQDRKCESRVKAAVNALKPHRLNFFFFFKEKKVNISKRNVITGISFLSYIIEEDFNEFATGYDGKDAIGIGFQKKNRGHVIIAAVITFS